MGWSPIAQHAMGLADMTDRVHGNMTAAGRAVPLGSQPGGNGRVIDPLACQLEEPALHLGPARQNPVRVHRDRHLEFGDRATAPDDPHADAIRRCPSQHDFVNQTAE